MKHDSGERPSQGEGAGNPESPPPSTRSLGGRGTDADWVEAQLARLDLLLEQLAEPGALAQLLLDELAPLTGAARGAVYVLDIRAEPAAARLSLKASYAALPGLPEHIALGEGLVGQCAKDQKVIALRAVGGEHFRVGSALGSSASSELWVVPIWLDEATLSVVELGYLGSAAPVRDVLLGRLAERRPRALEPGAVSVNGAGGAPPSAAVRLRQRGTFWGKLSHELRSPLNSVLVLSQLLLENAEQNLTAKQVAFARAIHTSGNDLLGLVNAISDLSKIENNRLVLEPTEMTFDHFRAHLLRAFEPVAEARGFGFHVELEAGLPGSILTDAKRVRQIMKCLLSNAFKFTENGRVWVTVAARTSGWSPEHERLAQARQVIAFGISDTGVGMSESEQRSILDAFPPERIESRRGSGASGLGLAISRELARLLGGELTVTSAVGSGSTFTLYLPATRLHSRASDEVPPESDPARLLLAEDLVAAGLSAAAAVSPSAPAERPRPGVAEPNLSRDTLSRDADPPSRRSSLATLAGLNVMLVDDDVRSAFALTGFLERHGVLVSHADDVREALERLGEGSAASALLIDAELLTAGTDDTVRHVLERCGRLPIIALTRPARAGEVAKVPPHVHLLTKPVDPRQLISVLADVVVPAAAASAQALESQSS